MTHGKKLAEADRVCVYQLHQTVQASQVLRQPLQQVELEGQASQVL